MKGYFPVGQDVGSVLLMETRVVRCSHDHLLLGFCDGFCEDRDGGLQLCLKLAGTFEILLEEAAVGAITLVRFPLVPFDGPFAIVEGVLLSAELESKSFQRLPGIAAVHMGEVQLEHVVRIEWLDVVQRCQEACSPVSVGYFR